MADTKIKDLTLKNPVVATDETVINDVAGGNLDKKITMSGLKTYVKDSFVLADVSDISATATEVNYTTDVTSNIQAQIDNKSAVGHTHTSTITDTLSVGRIPVIDIGVTSYFAPHQTGDYSSENDVGFLVNVAFTLTELKTKVLTNGITDNTVITVRKNGSNTTSTVTYGSGITTDQNDTTHTVVFAVGDILTIKCVGGASGTSITGLIISLTTSRSVTSSA